MAQQSPEQPRRLTDRTADAARRAAAEPVQARGLLAPLESTVL